MRSSKILIPAVLGVVVVAAFYFLALSPKRDEVAQLDTEITAKQAELDQSKATLVSYQDSKGRYEANYRTLVRMGKAVPADDDVRSLLVQLSDAADRSKVSFDAINVGASGAAPATETAAASTGALAPAPGTVAVGSAGFSAMPFSFGFEGSFFRLSDFFNRLEDFVTVQNQKIDVTGRLLLVGSISVTPSQGMKQLEARVGAASYLVPKVTGVAGAPAVAGTAAAPGATPDAGTTPATPTTPTATITGVR
jgi:hypothetical protein